MSFMGDMVDEVQGLKVQLDEQRKANATLREMLIRETRERHKKPDFDTCIQLKEGPAGEVLWALQNGEISRSKAAEALAEAVHGLEPSLPSLPDSIPDDVTPLEIFKENQKLKDSLEIQLAEKGILIEEIAKNAALKDRFIEIVSSHISHAAFEHSRDLSQMCIGVILDEIKREFPSAATN